MNFISALFAIVGFISGLISIYKFITSPPHTITRRNSILFGIVGVGILILALIVAKLPPTVEGNGTNTSTSTPISTGNSPTAPISNETMTPTPSEISHGGETLVIHAEGVQFVAQATTDYRFSYRGGAYSSFPCDSQSNDWTTALSISGSVTDTWFDFGHYSSWDQAQAKVYGQASVHSVHLNQGDAISLTPAGNAQCFGSYGAETVDVNW